MLKNLWTMEEFHVSEEDVQKFVDSYPFRNYLYIRIYLRQLGETLLPTLLQDICLTALLPLIMVFYSFDFENLDISWCFSTMIGTPITEPHLTTAMILHCMCYEKTLFFLGLLTLLIMIYFRFISFFFLQTRRNGLTSTALLRNTYKSPFLWRFSGKRRTVIFYSIPSFCNLLS